ncbi:MAG: GAF domain-containing protein [Gemmatimonadota bacterium]|jgi:GAF domain-containing protein
MATAIRAPTTTRTALDHYTWLVGRLLDVPAVCISLIDVDGWLTTSSYGLAPPNAMLVAWSFLRQTPDTGRPVVIDDARADPRAAQSRAVSDGMVAAYLGMRLVASDGCVVGTLSAMAGSPRQWTSRDLGFLEKVRDRILAMRAGTPTALGTHGRTDVAIVGAR